MSFSLYQFMWLHNMFDHKLQKKKKSYLFIWNIIFCSEDIFPHCHQIIVRIRMLIYSSGTKYVVICKQNLFSSFPVTVSLDLFLWTAALIKQSTMIKSPQRDSGYSQQKTYLNYGLALGKNK